MKYLWYITATGEELNSANLSLVKVLIEDIAAFEKENSDTILVGPVQSMQEAILQFNQLPL